MSLKVYYLDDEVDLCDNFMDSFSSDTISIQTFSDPTKLIEATKKSPPDMFFLDYRLPSITGDQVALMLPPQIPKFLVTGDITVETNYQFKQIFPKPYKEEAIFKAIEEFRSK